MAGLKFNAYYIIQRAVEEGVQYGLRRAFKHTDNPSEEDLAVTIEREVTNALWEVIDLEETPQ